MRALVHALDDGEDRAACENGKGKGSELEDMKLLTRSAA